MNLIPLAIFLFNYACVTSGATIRGGTTQQNDFGRNDEGMCTTTFVSCANVELRLSTFHEAFLTSNCLSQTYLQVISLRLSSQRSKRLNPGSTEGSRTVVVIAVITASILDNNTLSLMVTDLTKGMMESAEAEEEANARPVRPLTPSPITVSSTPTVSASSSTTSPKLSRSGFALAKIMFC